MIIDTYFFDLFSHSCMTHFVGLPVVYTGKPNTFKKSDKIKVKVDYFKLHRCLGKLVCRILAIIQFSAT